MTRARPFALVLLLGLTACGGGTEQVANERKTAAGEVLGGSISDAMLPLDTVQSQSPPLRETARDPASASKGDDQSPEGTTPTASVAAPEPAIAATPTPQTED